jgi:hypothetical protein
MVNVTASAQIVSALIVLLIMFTASALVLMLAVYEYHGIIARRRMFFSAVDYADTLRAVLHQKILLYLYVFSIVALTVIFLLLFLYQPSLSFVS